MKKKDELCELADKMCGSTNRLCKLTKEWRGLAGELCEVLGELDKDCHTLNETFIIEAELPWQD